MCLCAVLSHVRLFATPWAIATRLHCPWDSPSKNTRVGFHFLLQGNLHNQVIEPESLVSPALAGGFFTTMLPGKPMFI